MMKKRSDVYNEDFFVKGLSGSYRSALEVLPLILSEVSIKSVKDIGCGTGAWLKAYRDLGVENVHGFDGSYVDKSLLEIPSDCFTSVDLNDIQDLGGECSLIQCLEVLEHLSDKTGKRLVRLMCKCAPIVLFSAAVPGQGGADHINERWHDYWHNQFDACGFQAVDYLRPRISFNRSIDTWYRQNIFLYVNRVVLNEYPVFKTSVENPPDLVPIQPLILHRFSYGSGLFNEFIRYAKVRIRSML